MLRCLKTHFNKLVIFFGRWMLGEENLRRLYKLEPTEFCDICKRAKTRGPNTEGKMVCPVHCSRCGHDRNKEDYLDFCNECTPGEPCYVLVKVD